MTEFVETGGLRYGACNATWPFATLHASEQELTARCFGRTFPFRKDQVRLSKHRGLFSVGLLMERPDSKQPDFVVFWTFNFEGLRRKLAALGYEIHRFPHTAA